MQFDQKGLLVRRVRFFFAAPGAKLAPYETRFRSSNYGDEGGADLGPGETWDAVRSWDRGERPRGLDGQNPVCGDPLWWRDGTPADAPGLNYVSGFPACCGLPGYQGAGGVSLGGSSRIGCNPYTTVGQAFLTVSPYTTDLLAYSSNNWLWFFLLPGGYCQVSSSAASGPGGGPACANLVMASSFNNLRFSTCTYVGRLATDPAVAVYIGLDPVNLNTHIPWLLRFTRYRVASEGGVRIGPVRTAVGVHYTAAGGVQLGGVGLYPTQYHGQAGLEAGGVGTPSAHVAVEGGVAAGAESTHADRYHGAGGAKLGGASGQSVQLHAVAGIKAGGVSAEHVRLTAGGGSKLGGATSGHSGILLPCCPTTAIPNTLHGVGSAGTAFTCTWSAAVQGWPFNDPDTGIAFRLECVTAAGVSTFRCFNAQAGCSKTYTQVSKTCGHPFAVSTRTILSGGSCVASGTYDFGFSE